MRRWRLFGWRFWALLALAGAGLLAYVWSGVPKRAAVRALAKANPAETALQRQRAREAAARGRKEAPAQRFVPLARISKNLVRAVVVAEDARFFEHEGVDWDAVRESAERNLERRRLIWGGSTITQQLAKNLFFGTERSLVRKLRELVAARWLEEDLSKARILELYLNVIEWGDALYGCEAAARRYYRKPAAELSLLEAAGLAAMIPSPRRLNPEVDPRRHARAQQRVLRLLELAGHAGPSAASPSPEAAATAEPEPPAPEPGPPATEPAAAATPAAPRGIQ